MTIITVGAVTLAATAGLIEEPRVKDATRERPKANALTNATSPYLRQHAYNPVQWYEFGDKASGKAQEEDKPIFLSIGYAACHWCHVMAHESFEDDEIAAYLNTHFINIKVDREERPDIDTIYMTAVQMMTGSGGWPLSVFLTPELEPFFGGTYFPPRDMNGRTGFLGLLQEIVRVWEKERETVNTQAERLTSALEMLSVRPKQRGELSADVFPRAEKLLRSNFDATWGGFSGAPKFPQAATLRFLLRRAARTGSRDTLDMATTTLDRMAAGGMYDQIGGGFHRYSVDARWLVPHFEKMLYDNAQLARVYIEAYQLTGAARYKRIAQETLDYVLRDMTDEKGGFHSSEDADSEGEEGRYYVWTLDELREVFGDEAWDFAEYYGATTRGNFEGRNVLHVARPLHEIAAKRERDPEQMAVEFAAMREKLRKVRETRVRPGRDDKVLAEWNGLMISALALGAQAFNEPRYAEAAARAAEFITTVMMPEGELHRSWRAGTLGGEGFLDDYAAMAHALIDLYETTFEPKWLKRAETIVAAMNARFWDARGESYYFTEADRAGVLTRVRPSYDDSIPSGNAIAAQMLLRLGALTGNEDYTRQGEAILKRYMPQITQSPAGFHAMLNALDFALGPTYEIVIIGPPPAPATRALADAAHKPFVPARVLLVSAPGGTEGSGAAVMPLAQGRGLVDGKPAAYICRDKTCGLPLTEPAALEAQLRSDAVAEFEPERVRVK